MYKPKAYAVQGKLMTLYSIGELASAIMRDTNTVRKWELYGLIPRARFRDKHGRRLYAREEIEALVKIVAEENPRTGVPFKMTRLKERVQSAWEQIRKQDDGAVLK